MEHTEKRTEIRKEVREIKSESVPAPAAKPAAGLHPEQVDPLGRMHHKAVAPEERRTTFILTLSLVAAVILIPIIAATSESPLLNVFLGLLPLFATIVLDMIAVRQHFKLVTLWVILVTTHLLGLAVLYFINFLLIVPVNVPSAVSASLLLGLIVTALCVLAQGRSGASARSTPRPVAFRPERIHEYVHSIEDKAKALNFAVGRVYRTSNGGTMKMRERLRIPSEWYNEFNEVKDAELKEKLERAKIVVRKIRDRLTIYKMKEKEVFSQAELDGLRHIARHKDGDDTILTVLKTNDSDPVENYYNAAVDFCDRILDELEKKE
jgi:hypothetical protein